jgi:anti-sigma factor ChrR (cupin superfamily)
MSLLPCCRDAVALLTEDEEGALAGAAKLKFSVHLTICTVCQRMRAQLQTTRAVLRGLVPESSKKNDVDAILALLAAPPPDDELG